jgi:hypothetical protein
MKVIKKPAGPIAIRISAGGVLGLGNYLVYRGPLTEVRKILMDAIETIDGMTQEPDIDFNEFIEGT